MPPWFSDTLIQPIIKGNNRDSSLSGSYCGIALTSCFSKVIELCVIEMYGECLLTSELQFGFKPGLSTTMCTGVLKAVVSRYLDGGSKVFGCLVDASKAFDTVDHTILLDKLLSRGLPNVMVCFLLRGTSPSICETKWNSFTSDAFSSVFYSVYSLHRRFAEGVVTFQCGLLLGEYLCWCSCIC